jgi:hypothetical protein
LAALARALRPLKQTVPSRHELVLDEPTTAERAADDPFWLPALRPARERRWDMVVVVDDHPSMAVWRETVDAVVAMLRRLGAFRDVAVRLLNTDSKDPSALALGVPGGGLASSGTELLTATGRRIVLVLTDGTAPAWHTEAALPLLHRWAARLPVVIVQLLPQQQWFRTGIRPSRVRLHPSGTGAANARAAWRLHEPATEPDRDQPALVAAGAVPVPVLELRPRWLARWVRLITGDRSGWISLPAVFAMPAASDRLGDRAGPREPAVDPRRRVQEFTSWATPTALTLATHLAAAPLNLTVMRTVARQLVPASDASHLSEIINSGLLQPVATADEAAQADRVTFEFDRGVREELLAVGRRADAVRVLRVVDEQFGSRMPAVSGLSRVLDNPEAAPDRPVTPETAPFVRVEQTVLQALSGRYLGRARRLQDALISGGAAVTEPDHSPANVSPTTTAVDPLSVTIGAPAVADSPSPRASGGPAVSSTVAEPVTPVGHRTGRAPSIWGNVPPRNPNFTGREDLLDQLHERMGRGTTAVLPQALHGMGGVGKSQLAVEYVYRHQDSYDAVWWISAERPTQIAAALAELAQRMKLPVGLEANTAVPAVREALRLGTPYANWLLIFDNAESPEAVREYFPSGGPGSIMVTSRNPQWANVAAPLEVDVFSREESIELLRRRGPDIDDGAADRLAEALGDLPLAVEQAAAWRAETGMPAEEYLRLFEAKRIELLEVSAPVDYQLPVAAAWNVSLDRLTDSNPAALRLLQVCSFFAPEPIPRTLIGGAHSADIHSDLNAALRDPIRLNRAIREINRYALARIDHRTNSLQMHRLIQAVLVNRMSEADRTKMRHSAHLMLASSDRNDPTSPPNWRTYAELYPHLMASEAYESTEPWVQQLVDNESRYLYWWGDHEAAYDLSQRAFDARSRRLGTEAPATLAIGRWLGFMLFVLGRFGEAAALNSQLLAAHEHASGGEDTEDLLAAIGAVAADQRVAGNFAEALRIDEDLYQRHVRALGPDDPATLNAAHNLAVSVRLTGDYHRARDLDHDTQQRRVRLFGEDHAVTLESTRNLIIDNRELGDYVTAQARQQEVADRLTQQLSPGHPQALRAMRSLSAAMRKAGDHTAARALSEQVRAGFLTRYGEAHPDTIAATLNLAIDLRQTGDLEMAAQLGGQVHDRYRSLLGEQHPHTIAAALNWAVTQRLRGNLVLARQLDEDGHESLTRQLGEEHPLTLACSVNLASDLYEQGEPAAAEQRDAHTAGQLAQVLGDEHPTTLACLGNLAMDLAAIGRQGEADDLHRRVMAHFVESLGPEHPATAAAADLTLRANCDLDPMPL